MKDAYDTIKHVYEYKFLIVQVINVLFFTSFYVIVYSHVYMRIFSLHPKWNININELFVLQAIYVSTRERELIPLKIHKTLRIMKDSTKYRKRM